jgi:uncharacterized protein (DUF2062 family)
MRRYLIRTYIRSRRLIIEHLRTGLSPHRMALACAVACFIGTMPMLGPVTVLSLFGSWIFRLSIPLVMGLTVLMTPLQALLAIPFQRLGAFWFPVRQDAGLRMAGMVPWLEKVGAWQLQALEAWLIVMLPAAGFVYLAVWLLLKARQARKGF